MTERQRVRDRKIEREEEGKEKVKDDIESDRIKEKTRELDRQTKGIDKERKRNTHGFFSTHILMYFFRDIADKKSVDYSGRN